MSIFRRKKTTNNNDENTQLAINACIYGHVEEFLELITTHSWLPTVKDDNGDNLLHHAARNGSRFICALLLAEYHMSQLETNKARKIPLALAEESKWNDMCTILLPFGQGTRSRSKSRKFRLLAPRSTSGDEVSVPMKRKLRNLGKPNNSKYLKSKNPPTGNAKSTIKAALRRMGVAVEQVHKVCECFQLHPVRQGEVIMGQGLDPAHVYFVLDCPVKVTQKSALGDEDELGTFSSGCFGDLSVLLNCPRTCTVVACQSGEVWRLKAQDYIAAVGGQSKSEMKRSQRESRNRSHSEEPGLKVKALVQKRARAGSHGPATAQAVVETPNKKKITEVAYDVHGKAETIYKGENAETSSIVSGTTPSAILEMLLQHDDILTRDVLLTFRDFMTETDLFEFLESRYIKSGEQLHVQSTERLKILEVLCRWVCNEPLVDPKLRSHPQMVEKIRKFATKLPKNASAKYILRALEPEDASIKAEDEEKDFGILVQFTALGACRTDLQLEIPSAETLAGLMTRVMDTINQQIRSGTGGGASVEAKSFEFRACDTGLVLPTSVCPALLNIQQINCVPIDHNKCIANYMDPVLLAERLTLLDHSTFSKIQITEVRDQLWTKHPELCPNVVALTTRFNNVCCWIVSTILSVDKSKSRGQVIERMIELANELYFLGNFHGVVQVLSALNHPAVTRLKKTWTSVRQKSKSIFKCLSDIVNPQDNRSNYRDKLDRVIKAPLGTGPTKGFTKAIEPCLPYLGVFLSDIVFYEDGNPTTMPAYTLKGLQHPSPNGSDDVLMLNVSKFQGLGYILSDILSYQLATFEFGAISTLETSLSLDLHLNDQKTGDDELFYTRSFNLEAIGASIQANPQAEVSLTGNEQMFRWRTIKHRAVAPSKFGQTKSQNTGTSVDGQLWYERFSKSPTMTYLGVFRVGFEDVETINFADKIRRAVDRAHKSVHKTIVIELKEKLKQILILKSGLERNVLLMRTFADIRYLGFQEDCKCLYFLTDSTDGDCEVYTFTSLDQQSQESYLLLYRILQRWKKTSANASHQGRKKAQERLMDPQNGNSDGAFVLRDSYSSPGNYALSVKYSKGAEPITHFLIEKQSNGEVRLKDSLYSFSSLPELILYYCQNHADMPVMLEPRGSEFLTGDCPRIAANLIKREEHPEMLYFFGSLSRHEANVLLSRPQVMKEGVYLLRNSSDPGSYALSFIKKCSKDKLSTMSIANPLEVVHVLIQHDKGRYIIDGKEMGKTMDQVIGKLQNAKDVLPATLTQPCSAGYVAGTKFNSLADCKLVQPARFRDGDTVTSLPAATTTSGPRSSPRRSIAVNSAGAPYVGVHDFLDQVDNFEASLRLSQSSDAGSTGHYTDVFSIVANMEDIDEIEPLEFGADEDEEDDPFEMCEDGDEYEPDMPLSFASSLGALDLKRDSDSTFDSASVLSLRRVSNETTV